MNLINVVPLSEAFNGPHISNNEFPETLKVLLKHPKRSRKEIHCLFLSAFVNDYRDREKMQKMIRPVVFECRSLRLYQNMQKRTKRINLIYLHARVNTFIETYRKLHKLIRMMVCMVCMYGWYVG